MTDHTTAEQAEQGLAEVIEGLGELRNANSRDTGFRQWRQKTLTLLQRIWPGKPGRAQRFRRVAFAPGVGVNDEAIVRESYEKGFMEARRLLQFWLAEIKLNGLDYDDGSIDPDDDAFAMPRADESKASVSGSTGLGIEKAEFQVDSSPVTADADDLELEDVTGAVASAQPALGPASRVASTPTRIESPIPPAAAAAAEGAVGAPAPAAQPRKAEILQFPTPPPHAPEFRGLEQKPKKAAPANRPSKEKSGRTRLREMLGIDGKTGVTPAAEAATPDTAPPRASAPAAPRATPPASAPAPPAAEPTRASAPAPPAAEPTRANAPAAVSPGTNASAPPAAPPRATTPAAPRANTPAPSREAGATPAAASTPAPATPAPRARGRGGKPLAPGTSVRATPARGAAQKPTEPVRPTAPPAVTSRPAPVAATSATPRAESDDTERVKPERPGELVSAQESLREAIAGVFVTKPDLGAPAEPPTPAPATGSTAARGETVIEFPAPTANAPSRGSVGIPEIAAIARDLDALGVPKAEQGRVRDALLDLSRRLGAGRADWRLLQVGVSLVMRFPRLAARALPLLIPYFDRAA